jgi:hypothetical protein
MPVMLVGVDVPMLMTDQKTVFVPVLVLLTQQEEPSNDHQRQR